MTPPKIEVNSKDIDALGRIYLNTPCSLGDLYNQGVDLFEGLELIVHDNGWETIGIVESTKNGDYVVVINWDKVSPPKIFVDFQNTDTKGRIYLNCTGTISDLCDHGVQLLNGLKLVVHNEELETEAIVEFSEEEKIWVAVIDWDKLPP
jgi:hypothetical protein